jgi:hypothetical protein
VPQRPRALGAIQKIKFSQALIASHHSWHEA